MNEAEKAILEILEAYQAAVNEKDVQAFVSLYDQDVVIFDIWSEWAYKGLDAWQKMVIDWFGSLCSDRIIVELHDIQIHAESCIAVVHAFVTFKGISEQGKELRAIQNRFTWILKNNRTTWKIAHEHSSAPVDPETSKIILQPRETHY